MTPDDDDAAPPVSTATVYGFIDELRRVDGFRIGPREETAVARLLSELFARGLVKSERDLKPHLQPLLARTAEERERFALAFDRRFPPPLKASPPPPPVLPEVPPARPDRALRWAAAAVGVLLIGLVVRALLMPSDVGPQVEPTPAPPEPQTAPREVLDPTGIATTEAPKAVDQQAADDAVTVVMNAAAHWSYAPTLDELSQTLGPMIGWRPDGLAIRLHELTALPRAQPLPLLGFFKRGPYRIPGFTDSLVDVPQANLEAMRVNSVVPNSSPLALIALNAAALADPKVPLSTKDVEEAAGAAISKTLANKVPVYEVREKLIASGEFQRYLSSNTFPKEAGAIALVGKLKPAVSAADRYRAISLAADQIRTESAGAANPKAPQPPVGVAELPGAPWRPKPHYAAFARAPLWLPWAAAGGILALTFLWLAASTERRKAYLRRRRPESFFSIHELVADQIKDTGSRKLLLNRAAQRLQRWAERETDRLDIERTVTATLLAGKFTTVRARAKAQPDYLVLLEVSGANDVQAARLRALPRCLEERMLNVKVFYFSRTPAWCHAEAPAGYRAPFANLPVPIEELVSRFGDHRLIVLGSGERFASGADTRWAPSVQQLVRWPARAMLTPVGLSDWSAREFALARELELPLGRATEEGLLALAALLKLDEMEGPLYSARGDGRAQSLPQAFRLERVEWTLDQAPHDVAWEELRAMLVRYLDPSAYFWLCACAVYPAVRWDLTLFLGLTLEGGDGAKLYREDRLSALAALPWFREGRMPDWLRRRLIAEIENDAPAIRDVLRRLVERSRTAGQSEGESVTLRIATRDDAGVDEAFDDEIFLDFLAKGEVTDLPISWLDALKALIPNRALQWLDPTGIAVAGSGLAMATAAFILAPRGGRVSLLDGTTFADATLPHGAWTPLLIVMMAAFIAVALVDSGPLQRLGRASGSVMSFFLAGSLLAGLLAMAIPAMELAGIVPTEDARSVFLPLVLFGIAMIALVGMRAVRGWWRRPVGVPPNLGLATLDFGAKAAALAALALALLMLVAPSDPRLMGPLVYAGLAMLMASLCAFAVERAYERI